MSTCGSSVTFLCLDCGSVSRLKGPCHKIFDPRFFPWFLTIHGPFFILMSSASLVITKPMSSQIWEVQSEMPADAGPPPPEKAPPPVKSGLPLAISCPEGLGPRRAVARQYNQCTVQDNKSVKCPSVNLNLVFHFQRDSARCGATSSNHNIVNTKFFPIQWTLYLDRNWDFKLCFFYQI